jgi:hypothetical protein
MFDASMFINHPRYLNGGHDLDLLIDEYLFKGASKVHLDAQNIMTGKYVNCF